MAAKSMVKRVRREEDSVDKRASRSKGGLSSSNAPTVTSWRFPHRIRETSPCPEKVMYSSSRERRVDEEASNKSFSGKADAKLQSKTEIDENRRSRPARYETNREEAESKVRRFRNP